MAIEDFDLWVETYDDDILCIIACEEINPDSAVGIWVVDGVRAIYGAPLCQPGTTELKLMAIKFTKPPWNLDSARWWWHGYQANSMHLNQMLATA